MSAALLVALLPTQSLALPPDPGPSRDATGREAVELEPLEREEPIPGKTSSRALDTLKAEIPKDLLAAPTGATTPPSNLTGTVNFSSTTTTASYHTSATAQQAAMTPVENLPVSLGQAPDQPAPTGTWQVTIPDRTSPVSQGVDGAVLKVQAPDTGSVPVNVRLDYSKFQSLYGADWASRLRFVQFPECYLTTPDDEACQTYEELETTNDTATQSITATVDPAADGTTTPAAAGSTSDSGSGFVQAAHRTSTDATPVAAGGTAVIGAVDSGAGDGGSFKATPLASDGAWEAGGSSGAFTWSYPLAIPPAPAGPAPTISFEYNSQTVDGRTAVSSPQASWIGEGWNYDAGYIERRYRSCQDDRKTLSSGTPNNTAKKDKTSDLCWVSYNAVMSLKGQTTELVRDAGSGSNPETDTEIYRPQRDDGTRVEHRVGGANDDNNGEYWVVTTRDGTKYYYGQNQVGGGHADTNSVSTVPVFGNHPNEPCHAETFADSRCGTGKQQAWRWGLDKIVDVNGNTMIVNWKQETNHYAVRKKFKSPEQYDRYAYPASIEYGMRPDSLTKPSATVDFGVKQRCLKSATACDAANFAKTDDPGAYRPWWDTPGNLNCKSTSKLCPPFPSFWTQLRLDTVTTKAARAGQTGLGLVDRYTLHQSFPEDWYDSAPGLWLNSITRTGYGPGDTTGTPQSQDGISFGQYTVGATSPLHTRLKDRQLPNLVRKGTSDQRPGFTRPRIGVVSTEYGGDIEVEYTGGCASEPAEDKGRSNSTCYPVRWSPDGDEKTPAKAWFNKYVVDSVTETDKVTSHGKPIITKYQYTVPAWAKSDDEFTRPALRTYSDWKGYRQVATRKGSRTISEQGDVNSQSYTVTRYFQGAGGEVKDSKNLYTLLADDAPQFAGMTAETITYRDSDGKILKRDLTFPYSKQTASRARQNEDGTAGEPLLAHRVGVKRTDAIQTADEPGWRAVRTLTTFDDTYGLPLQVETAVVKPNGSGGETLSDRSCTTTTYGHNTSAWLIGLAKEQRVTGTSCSGQANADPATQLKSAVRNTYDNQSYGDTPTRGLVTLRTENDATGASYSFEVRTTYDPLGRVRTVTAPGTGTTETQYIPGDEGGPVTQAKSINTKGHTTTTTYDPGRALALTVSDPNGRVTRYEYDALGRLVKGWSPSRSAVGQSPNVQISYQMAVATPDRNSPAAISVQTLKDDGTYSRAVTFYDGLQREVQQQTEAHGPGRIIADTSYNDHGLVDEKTVGYLVKGEPSTELFTPRSKSLIPNWIKHRYDGLEREVRASTYHSGDYQYATYTTYSDTSTYVNPAGPTAPRTRTYYDALGRVTSIKHYSQDESSSATGRTTTYEYDDRGNQSKITDPAGNVWTYSHDARGRVTSATDPDTGTTETWYDEADRPNHVKNARGQETFTEYDPLGRLRYVRQGSATASPTKEFTYDDLPGGLGKPIASIRHTADGDYTNRVTGYDSEYHVTGTETVIPANSMTAGLSGTYAYAYAYTPTGKPLSVTLPAKGGLASEKVVTRYNNDGLAESTSGLTWYTSDATYSPYGEVLRTVSSTQPYRVWTSNFIDPHTGRLQRTVTDRETSGPHRITDSYYSYDASGTITSNARQLSDAAGNTWDTQCFTYDAMGELVHAWTSNITPAGNGTACKAANGAMWGPRTDYTASSGPVTDAPDEATDVTSPDSALASSRSAAAPDPVTVSTGGTAYRQTFTFDWIGNRAALTEHDTADATKNVSFTYNYGKTVAGNGTTPSYKTQPHTMTWISSTPSGKGSTYTYDATGNTEVRDLYNTTQNLVWTPENKLDHITDDGKKTTYVYDADGDRILENSSSGSTLYLGDTELTTDPTGTITNASRSYTQAGAPTVVRATNGATTGHKLSVLLADNLGTANTSVDVASGQTATRRAFKPYGDLRGTKPANWPNKRGYLGTGIDDAATGLTHIGAREYDQEAGRFLSADPIIDFADPLQVNGYAYSNNSPISRSDPTGLESCYPHYCSASNGTDSGSTYTPAKDPASTCYANRDTRCGVGYTDIGDGAAPTKPPVTLVKDYMNGYPSFTQLQRDNGAYFTWLSTALNMELYFRERCTSSMQLACVGLREFYDGWKHVKSIDSIDTCPICGNIGLDVVLSLPMGRTSRLGKGAGGSAAAAKRLDCMCFLAGTDVLLADGSTKDIEDVELGDKVLATDPKTGRTVPKKVTHLIRTEGDKYFNELSIATEHGIEKLTATEGHPFWSPSQQDWIHAGQLKPGMTLRTEDGDTVVVTANRPFTRHARTYNLTVEGLHTYYVLAGKTPVLVHNSSCWAGKGGPGTWGTVNEAMSARAAAYQTRVTGVPNGLGYTVKGVKFDGFQAGTLLDAKGPGYAGFVKDGRFRPWYDGADGLADQAQRQLNAAGGTPITWHVAEANAVTAMRNLFADRGISGIKIVHTP
ncbi:polymorphic toxin-type HINT domain-containing protein [Streptomyces shenzhenensis]|uniref:polymorphic toxin-type HINT domain-containing protein n=1 Tax=Streptomyces shenzhenensis TaxID=943815 RepID=UPI003F5424CC